MGDGWIECGLGERRAASIHPSGCSLGSAAAGRARADPPCLGDGSSCGMLRFREPEAADMSTWMRSEWRLFIRAPASILLLAVFAVLACTGAVNGVQRVIESRQLATQALDADAKSFAAK